MTTLTCPHCGFNKEIPAAQIPPGTKRLTCPKCRQSFPLRDSMQPPAAAGTAPASEPPEEVEQVIITCPYCAEQREVPRAKIPDRAVKVVCQKCRKDFTLTGHQSREKTNQAPPQEHPIPTPDQPVRALAADPTRRRLASIDELFTRSWQIFKSRILTLLGINLLAILLAVVAYLLLGSGIDLLHNWFGDNPVVIILTVLVMAGFSMLVFSAIGAATIYAIVDEDLGVRSALGYGIQNFSAFLWLFSLLSFIIGGGYLLFFLPGVLFTVWFILAQYILAHDDIRGMDALLKSREYVRGHGWGVGGRMLLMVVVGTLVSLIPVIGLLLNLLIIPFSLIYYHEILKDLREIKNNLSYVASRGIKAKWLLSGAAGYLVAPAILLAMMGPGLLRGATHWGFQTSSSRIHASPAAVSMTTGNAQLNLGRNSFAPGEAISVEFFAPDDLPADAWVGIIPSAIPHGDESRNDEQDLEYRYLDHRTSGTLEFSAPGEPGRYDLRMHDTDSNGREIASVSFGVDLGESTETPSRTAPTSAENAPAEATPTTIYVPMTGENPEQVMVYIYAINYLGSVRLNGEEFYSITGERDMNYNHSGTATLVPGSNFFEIDYKALPDPWMTELKLKIFRYDWDAGEETVLGEWTIQDAEGNLRFEVVLGN